MVFKVNNFNQAIALIILTLLILLTDSCLTQKSLFETNDFNENRNDLFNIFKERNPENLNENELQLIENFIYKKIENAISNIKTALSNTKILELLQNSSIESNYNNDFLSAQNNKTELFHSLINIISDKELLLSASSNSSINLDEYHNTKDSIFCQPCHHVMNKVDKLIAKRIGFNLIKRLLTEICSLAIKRNVCEDAIIRYGDIVYDSIMDHYLDSEFVCTFIKVCKNHYIPYNPDEYAIKILKDKPEINPPIFPSNSTLKILHLTDLHIDFYYEAYSEAECGEPQCCRDKKDKPKKEAGYWGAVAACDLPLRTLEAMIEQISEEIKPDLVLWTGDNGSHDVWKLSNDTAAVSTRQIGNLIYEKLVKKNGILLIPSIGNHEERNVDEFNVFDMNYESILLKNISEVYKQFIGEEKASDFSKDGYFTMLVPNTKLRVISINCFLCDTINFFLVKNPTDPLGQMEYLRQELDKAEKAGEVVFIIGHIPPGDWNYLAQCSYRYNVLMERYQNIIRGQFYGHTHWDEIRILHSYSDISKIIGMEIIAPSGTT